MTHRRWPTPFPGLLWLCAALVACDAPGHAGAGDAGNGGGRPQATGGAPETGGRGATGGALGTGGRGATGGSMATGGDVEGGTGAQSSATGGMPAPDTLVLPPQTGGLDYQLGAAYPPPAGVTILSRDRLASPASGYYTLCYINGFQVQPGEEDDWEADLILRDGAGQPVIDADWDEWMLDVSTAAKRSRIGAVVGGFIQACKQAGFDAIEIDNLDTYSRSDGRISRDDAVAMMRVFSDQAHAVGLAIAQKNSTELLDRRAQMGTDFAVAEECARWNECQEYVDVYGAHVLMIEYRRQDFDAACAGFGPTHPVVLRDLDLVGPNSGGYVFDGC